MAIYLARTGPPYRGKIRQVQFRRSHRSTRAPSKEYYTSPLALQRDDVVRGWLEDGRNERRQLFECVGLLTLITKTIVDALDPDDRVAEYPLADVRQNASPRHERPRRASQVVQGPGQ